MCNRQCNRTFFDSVSFQKSAGYIAGSLMTFYNSYFYKIFFRISYKFTVFIQPNVRCCLFRHDSSRKNLDHIHFITCQMHFKLFC